MQLGLKVKIFCHNPECKAVTTKIWVEDTGQIKCPKCGSTSLHFYHLGNWQPFSHEEIEEFNHK